MKNILFLFMIVVIFSCKKDKPMPILTTSTPTAITKTSGASGGNITNDGGETIISRGVCWSINTTPTIADNKTSDGAGAGNFTSTMIGLTPNTTYFVRAFATNVSETGYGMTLSFTTQPAIIPTLTTANVTTITQNSAICGGTITSDGAALITSRGVCFSTTQNPTIFNRLTMDGSGTGSFVSNLTGLSPATTYYVRAYATNSVGTNYGNQGSFKTSPLLPTISTANSSSITSNTASVGGNISSDGGASVTARGVCWSISVNPTISSSVTMAGSGTGSFVSNLTGLSPATTYYVRAYATNTAGTAYGNEVSFNTSASAPTLMTSSISFVTSTSAKSGGMVSSDGGLAITAKGVCWNTSTMPTVSDQKTNDGSGNSNFTSAITGLQISTIYYVRAYATNSLGTTYGNELTFRTYTGSVTDIDGNVYHTVIIGNQLWMAENLKTTKYANGTPIPLVNTQPTWYALTTTSKAYCWSDDNINNIDPYGALYTWAAAMNGSVSSTTKPSGVQGVCPTGWHLPSDAECTTLTTFLGGASVAGGKLKETGTTHWLSPNIGATNISGFTALPGGNRNQNGTFLSVGYVGFWWSSTENRTFDAFYMKLHFNNSNVEAEGFAMKEGYSVRCIKD